KAADNRCEADGQDFAVHVASLEEIVQISGGILTAFSQSPHESARFRKAELYSPSSINSHPRRPCMRSTTLACIAAILLSAVTSTGQSVSPASRNWKPP